MIDRYEKGKANDTERRALDTWIPDTETINKDTPDRKVLTELNAEVWHRLVRQYLLDNKQGEKPSVIRHIWYTYRRYAAIVTVVLITGSTAWLIYNHSDHFEDKTMMADARKAWATDDSHRTTVTLPDGTLVQINAGSRLEIAEAAFNKKIREVWLTGEAFFEVAKNPQKPFIIHTNNIQTTVRGTSFNIKAYPQLAENVVSVRTGKVEITRGKEQLASLTANKQLRYSTINHTSKTSDLNWQNAAGWTEGKLVLNGAGGEELKMRLQQQFGVTVTITNNALNGKSLSGSFRKERTLKEVINTISAVYNIHYEIKDNHVTITP